MTDRELTQRITDYLTGGGLFNPEMANHEAVRDLLIDCRDALAQPEPSANMFWNINNPESGPFDCIYAAVEDEFNNGDLQIGDTLRFMQAVALPNVEVKITSVYQDDFEFKLMTGEQA